MIVSKATIEREALEAAQKGQTMVEACPYPFTSDEGRHFAAHFALAAPRTTAVDTGDCSLGAQCTIWEGYCPACCS